MWQDTAKEIGSLGPDACSVHGPQTAKATEGTLGSFKIETVSRDGLRLKHGLWFSTHSHAFI